MACDLTLGRLEPCKDTAGGVKNIYLGNYDRTVYSTATLDADEQITAFASPLTLYKYELKGAVHNLEETAEVSEDNGTAIWTQTLTAILKKQDLATRKELKLAAYGSPFVIVEDYNGNFKLIGFENGTIVTPNTATGSAMVDLNGYNLTIVGTEKEPANFVDPAIIGDTVNTVVVSGT